jgi:hypothetical protein
MASSGTSFLNRSEAGNVVGGRRLALLARRGQGGRLANARVLRSGLGRARRARCRRSASRGSCAPASRPTRLA